MFGAGSPYLFNSPGNTLNPQQYMSMLGNLGLAQSGGMGVQSQFRPMGGQNPILQFGNQTPTLGFPGSGGPRPTGPMVGRPGYPGGGQGGPGQGQNTLFSPGMQGPANPMAPDPMAGIGLIPGVTPGSSGAGGGPGGGPGGSFGGQFGPPSRGFPIPGPSGPGPFSPGFPMTGDQFALSMGYPGRPSMSGPIGPQVSAGPVPGPGVMSSGGPGGPAGPITRGPAIRPTPGGQGQGEPPIYYTNTGQFPGQQGQVRNPAFNAPPTTGAPSTPQMGGGRWRPNRQPTSAPQSQPQQLQRPFGNVPDPQFQSPTPGGAPRPGGFGGGRPGRVPYGR